MGVLCDSNTVGRCFSFDFSIVRKIFVMWRICKLKHKNDDEGGYNVGDSKLLSGTYVVRKGSLKFVNI